MTEEQKQTIEVFNRTAKRYSETIARLDNYNHTYDYLAARIMNDSTVLELACGPAHISAYIAARKKINVIGFDLSEEMLKIARRTVPGGRFIMQSIIDFNLEEKADIIINGFGLPYLDSSEVKHCITRSAEALKTGGLIYVSFMNGDKKLFETPSFSDDSSILIHYHDMNTIENELTHAGIVIDKRWELDYFESDGSITKDVVIIGEKSV
jgi:ubiquinone/menaquinone biosynthesis C-methylase UbiE